MNLALKIHIEKQEDLIDGCIRGDRQCQNKLYELFHGKMLSVCMRYAKDREEARDVFHEGFVKVFRNLHKFEPKSSLESWIRRIMINTAIDQYRKTKKRRVEVDIEYASTKKFNNNIIEQLSAEEILKLVQKLSPGYRAVFNLYVIDGFTHKEIGQKLSISEGTSKSNLAKARAKLKIMISKEMGDIYYK